MAMNAGLPEVVFVCTHNAGRSQMAAALMTRQAQGRVVVRSAGTQPGEVINSAVVSAMAEVGIDLSDQSPRRLTDEMLEGADVVVTMGCGDACPVLPGRRYLDWDLPDPSGKDLATVRSIRDAIDLRITALLGELTTGP
jgi:protein-tyrosine-phosphatase